MRCLVIGNPENRRVAFFQRALHERGLPAAQVCSYLDLLRGRVGPDLPPADWVRIESPGECFEVERALIGWGLEEADEPATADLESEPGRHRHTRACHLGFARLLARLEACNPEARWMNPPASILAMFDKHAAHQRMRTQSTPRPEYHGLVTGIDRLRAISAQRGLSRLFLKPRFGSSAAGVLAYRRRGSEERITTTLELERPSGKLYNHLNPRTYHRDADIRHILETLLPDELVVESWLPKANWRGYSWDLRVLVIAGEARHVVPRMSRSPLTNLHLGNRRGDLDTLSAHIGASRVAEMSAAAERAARAFPDCLYVAVDVAIRCDLKRVAVLEVNAFGDLLPGLLHRGRDSYAAEVAALLEVN
ncbi:STM4014 family protein [Sulfidibacter corallicola]|uniref:STM4014 family protein n=1 Tax=Sulfidibacter corallicola TaxID=2818388 RepID=A0A8A4TJV8_SULCO|nr:STM4014 family protein [Sulfidibacter corallicola]QTD50216.1 STM4014 family protein [Sulfidibacter corallicola]